MRCYVPIAIACVVVVLVCRAQPPPQTLEPSPTTDHPLVEVDLRKFGYERLNGKRPTRTFIDFTDSNHLAVAWLTLDNPSGAKKFGPVATRPAHLHVLVLADRTGQKENQREWPTPYLRVGFGGIPDGKLVTCTGSTLRLFSPSLELIREQELPSNGACQTPYRVETAISPSRRTLLFSTRSGSEHQMELLDTETFATLSSWTEERVTGGISDHWLVGFCGSATDICLRRVDGLWHPFHPNGLDKDLSDRQHKVTSFAGDETLVIEGGDRMAVTTVQGVVLFQVRLAQKHLFGSPATSAGGEKLAVIENRLRGLRSEPLDMYPFASNDRAVVYSIADRRAIYVVKLEGTSPWTPWDWHENQLALSPDGTLLAVLSDGVARVYRPSNGSPAQH